MKSYLLAIIAAMIILLTSTISFAKSDEVIEFPNYKVVIDGKLQNAKEKPITINKKLMLPLNLFFAQIGRNNNGQNMKTNTIDKNITIYKKKFAEASEKYISIYSNNGGIKSIPYYYNNAAYVPVEVINTVFDKVAEDDRYSEAIYFSSSSMLEKVTQIIKQSQLRAKDIKKLKQTIYAKDTRIDKKVKKSRDYEENTNIDIDLMNNIVHEIIKNKGGNVAFKRIENYYSDYYLYRKFDNEDWYKCYNDEGYAIDSLNLMDLFTNYYPNSGLVAYENKNDFILKGFLINFNSSEMYFSPGYQISDSKVEIVIDKKTYLIKSYNATFIQKEEDGGTHKYVVKITYQNMPKDYQIKIPPKIKSAKEEPLA